MAILTRAVGGIFSSSENKSVGDELHSCDVQAIDLNAEDLPNFRK